MAYWDEHNPWRDKLTYVPIRELAEALDDGSMIRQPDGSTVRFDVEYMLDHFGKCGDRLDAYVLPRGDGNFYAGVRYGSDGPDYLSLHIPDHTLVGELLARHAEGAAPRP